MPAGVGQPKDDMGGVARSEEIPRTDNAMTTNQIPPHIIHRRFNTVGEVIKLGIDVHIEKYVIVIKIDGSAPARAKRFTPEQFMVWVEKLAGRCEQLYSCYEAGPFGYSLHRPLEKMGVTNHVIRPINWDEHGKNVKTDARDATQMVLTASITLSFAAAWSNPKALRLRADG